MYAGKHGAVLGERASEVVHRPLRQKASAARRDRFDAVRVALTV